MDAAAGKHCVPGRDMPVSGRIAWTLGASALVVVAGAGFLLWSRHQATVTLAPAAVPLGHKVTVEVLNTTTAPGIARVARDVVRHGGLDVVYFGSAEAKLRGRAQSEVLVRRGDTTGVGRIIEVIGPVVVTDAPDRSRDVDLTLLIGTDYLKRATASRP
jgi:hypothetical protein